MKNHYEILEKVPLGLDIWENGPSVTTGARGLGRPPEPSARVPVWSAPFPKVSARVLNLGSGSDASPPPIGVGTSW